MQELVEIQGGSMFEAQQRRRFNDDATQFDEMQENPHSSAMQLPMPLAVQPPVSFNPAALQVLVLLFKLLFLEKIDQIIDQT